MNRFGLQFYTFGEFLCDFLCICAQIDILNGRWNCQMNQNEKGEYMLNWRGDFKGYVFFFPVTQRKMSLIIPTSKEFSLI